MLYQISLKSFNTVCTKYRVLFQKVTDHIPQTQSLKFWCIKFFK